MSVEFPRMATIPQAHEESGIPTYRIRRAEDVGQFVQFSRMDGRQRAATAARYPPGAVMTRKKPPRCWNTETAQKWRKKPASPLHSHFIKSKGVKQCRFQIF